MGFRIHKASTYPYGMGHETRWNDLGRRPVRVQCGDMAMWLTWLRSSQIGRLQRTDACAYPHLQNKNTVSMSLTVRTKDLAIWQGTLQGVCQREIP